MSSLLYTVPFGSQVYGLTNSKSDKDYKKMLKSLQHTFRMYCPKSE